MYVLDKLGYLARVVASNPLELVRVARIAMATARYRYLARCIGPDSVVGIGTTIVNTANVRIGRRALLQDFVYIRAGTRGKVVMGDRVAINSFCRIFGHGTVTVGDDVQIGPGVLITTTGHDYRHELETSFRPVAIGRGAWIGANATILPGVEIGDGAVIGAGSVVNRSIPARAVAVGVPARVIRTLDPAG